MITNLVGLIPAIAVERFWAKVAVTPGCWIWTGSLSKKGYGSFGVRHVSTFLAHRVAYELLIGPIPEGLELDHLCLNKACVNPAVHLRTSTSRPAGRKCVGLACVNRVARISGAFGRDNAHWYNP